jgi:hypothetical protein
MVLMANLNDFCSAQCLASCDWVICAIAIIEFLPFLLQVIHCFLLLLTCRCSVEPHEVACWVKFEYLGPQFEIIPDENHGWCDRSAMVPVLIEEVLTDAEGPHSGALSVNLIDVSQSSR